MLFGSRADPAVGLKGAQARPTIGNPIENPQAPPTFFFDLAPPKNLRKKEERKGWMWKKRRRAPPELNPACTTDLGLIIVMLLPLYPYATILPDFSFQRQ